MDLPNLILKPSSLNLSWRAWDALEVVRCGREHTAAVLHHMTRAV